MTSMVLCAQAPEPPKSLAVPRFAKAPAISRSENLSDWAGALRITEFGNWYPVDKGKPPVDTVAYLGWGPDGLYVAVEAHDPDPASIRAFPSRRDNMTGSQDSITVDLDATGKGQAAVSLTCNALGVQSDGMIIEGSWGGNYDLLWDSAGVRTSYGFLVKIRIPYTSLRRLPGEWGIRISRFHSNGRGLTFAWPQQSQDRSCDLCQLAKVSGAPIANEGAPFLVIPTFTARRTESVTNGTLGKPDQELRPGLDLRYSGRAITVDGTYRPDFSAVEADIDPLNINSRFKYRYPEKRPFFQEGLEVFSASGAQQQFSSRSLLEPEYGLKTTGRATWGSWGALQVQDNAGGASLASDGFLTDGLKTRNLVAATRIDTDSKGSNLTLMGTDALLLGGGSKYTGRSGGVYLDQRIGEHFKVSASRIESWANLPDGNPPPTTSHGSATAWNVNWSERIWWAGTSGSATSPDLVLANGFVDLAGYKSNWAGSGVNFRSAKAWWSYVGGGINFSRSDWWDGSPMSRHALVYANLSTKFRLNLFANVSLRGREWAQGRVVETRSFFLNGGYSRFAFLRPSISLSHGRVPVYSTGLPAVRDSRTLNLNGNISALSYSIQGSHTQLRDDASGGLILRAQRLYTKVEYSFPFDTYLRAQAQLTRYEAPGREPTRSRYLQILAGWQPNAFTQVYLGYSQSRKTDLDLTAPREHLMVKGLFAKASYAIRF